MYSGLWKIKKKWVSNSFEHSWTRAYVNWRKKNHVIFLVFMTLAHLAQWSCAMIMLSDHAQWSCTGLFYDHFPARNGSKSTIAFRVAKAPIFLELKIGCRLKEWKTKLGILTFFNYFNFFSLSLIMQPSLSSFSLLGCRWQKKWGQFFVQQIMNFQKSLLPCL